MRPGAIVNISDFRNDFYCKDGQVIEVAEGQVIVMFLILNRDNRIDCIIERFKLNQVYQMKGKSKLIPIRPYIKTNKKEEKQWKR